MVEVHEPKVLPSHTERVGQSVFQCKTNFTCLEGCTKNDIAAVCPMPKPYVSHYGVKFDNTFLDISSGCFLTLHSPISRILESICGFAFKISVFHDMGPRHVFASSSCPGASHAKSITCEPDARNTSKPLHPTSYKQNPSLVTDASKPPKPIS